MFNADLTLKVCISLKATPLKKSPFKELPVESFIDLCEM